MEALYKTYIQSVNESFQNIPAPPGLFRKWISSNHGELLLVTDPKVFMETNIQPLFVVQLTPIADGLINPYSVFIALSHSQCRILVNEKYVYSSEDIDYNSEYLAMKRDPISYLNNPNRKIKNWNIIFKDVLLTGIAGRGVYPTQDQINDVAASFILKCLKIQYETKINKKSLKSKAMLIQAHFNNFHHKNYSGFF